MAYATNRRGPRETVQEINMPETTQEAFHCEIEEINDENQRPATIVHCHGRLVAGGTEGLRTAVHPLIAQGGRTIIDCAGVSYIDSMGLGALVALKVSSVHKGFGTLEFSNLSPRIKELLRITKLTEYLARPDTVNYGS